MRAQSPHDVAAAYSDRPDHGPMGAYDAWPAVTIDALCRLGYWNVAVPFLRRTRLPFMRAYMRRRANSMVQSGGTVTRRSALPGVRAVCAGVQAAAPLQRP
jgi:hypothetical protein